MSFKKKYQESFKQSDQLIKELGKEKFYKIFKDKFLKNLKKDSDNQENINSFQTNYKGYTAIRGKNEALGLGDEMSATAIRLSKDKNLIIFKLNEELLNKVNLKDIDNSKLILPYHSFYVDKLLFLPVDEEKEVYVIQGFIVQYIEKKLFLQYLIARTIGYGLFPTSYVLDKENLGLDKKVTTNEEDLKTEQLQEEIQTYFRKKVEEVLIKLMKLIETKEYSEYKKNTPTGYETHKIVYESEVKAHKRHFWKDTGYFKIPDLSREKILEKGYEIDELVVRGNEMRQNVPYVVIGSFSVEGKEKKERKTVNLIEKKNLRQEQKLLTILNELFPFEYIKKHDRKTLKGLELDFLIWKHKLAFEYDGEQHYDKKLCEEVFKSDFEELKKRDRKKNKLCKKKNIRLVRIKYDEPLTKTHIKSKIKLVCPNLNS